MAKIRALGIVALMLISIIAAFVPAAPAEESEPPAPDIAPMGTQRVVLAELMTGAWCGPCVNANKGLEMVENNLERDEVVILAYHSSDALSTSEGNARLSLYNPSGIPHIKVDGILAAHGSAGTPAQNYNRVVGLINQRSAITSPFRLTVEWDYDDITGEGDAWINITAVDTPSLSNLKLHTVVFEMDYGPYNGGNGETIHNWVTRDFLESEGASGTTVDLTQGQTKDVEYSFDASSYAQDLEEIGIIAFVQSYGTSKEVLQAAYVNVPVLPNVPPILDSGQAAPLEATEDDDITFKVLYRDTDDRNNDGPTETKVYIKNGTSPETSHDLIRIASGLPFTEGVWFRHITTLAPGTYTYRFSANDGEDAATGDIGWNATQITILPRNKVPQLSTHSYAPLEGDTTEVFRFDVMYRDGDNDAPVDAYIYLNEEAYVMSTDDTGPWNDWMTYYHETALSVGDNHMFYFMFSDGEDSVRLPAVDASPNWFRGPSVVKPNNEPTLTTPLFHPDEGTRMDEFTFTIVYTDGENDHPTVSYIYIDGVANILDPDGFEYANGEVFRYRTRLGIGQHTISFLFNDGKNEVRYPSTGTVPGPTIINLDPIGVILTPSDGRRYTPEEYISFSAIGSDDPESDPLDYKWTSSIDGELSTQDAFDERLSEGDHVITLEVTDEYGGMHTISIEILVKALTPEPFVVSHDSTVDTPVEKDMIRYTFVLDNRGEAIAQGIEVKFFVDDTLVNSDTVSVSVGNQVEVRFTWEAVIGSHNIRVEIPGDSYEFQEIVDPNSPPLPTTEIKNDGGKDVKYKAGTEIYFEATASDENGDSLTYEWNFGDGITSTKAIASHIYSDAGTYTVTLTVTDSRGDSNTDTFDVEIIKEKAEGDESPGFGAVVAIAAFVAVIVAVSRRRM